MAWQFGDGFDLYAAGADAATGYWDVGGNQGAISLVAGRFAGSRGMQNNTVNQVLLVKSSGVNDAVHHLAVAIQTSALAAAGGALYLQLLDGTTGQCCVVFGRDGTITLTSGTYNGTALATYTGALAAINTWYAFEFEIVIHPTAGSFAVRKNGNTTNDFSASSLATRVSANSYANKLQVGMGNTTTVTQTIDDLYWRSDASTVPWLGDIRCYTRLPASDASVQFSRTPTGVLTQTVPTSAPSSAAASSFGRYTAFVAGYSGTVTSVSVAINSVGTIVNMKCAIYADNAGVPGAILASATAPVTPVVLGSNVFTFSGVTIVKGTQYWIGACADGTTGTYTTSSGTSAAGTSSTTAYATFPQANPVVTAPANAVQMSWTYTATPANWQAVSEPQQDTTTSYVYDSTPGDADFYGIAPIASTPVATYAVTTRGYMEKSDAGTRTAAVQLKSGSTTVASSTVVLTTSGWLWAWRMDTVDPNTSAAWTAAAVNNAQVGPKVIA